MHQTFMSDRLTKSNKADILTFRSRSKMGRDTTFNVFQKITDTWSNIIFIARFSNDAVGIGEKEPPRTSDTPVSYYPNHCPFPQNSRSPYHRPYPYHCPFPNHFLELRLTCEEGFGIRVVPCLNRKHSARIQAAAR